MPNYSRTTCIYLLFFIWFFLFCGLKHSFKQHLSERKSSDQSSEYLYGFQIVLEGSEVVLLWRCCTQTWSALALFETFACRSLLTPKEHTKKNDSSGSCAGVCSTPSLPTVLTKQNYPLNLTKVNRMEGSNEARPQKHTTRMKSIEGTLERFLF